LISKQHRNLWKYSQLNGHIPTLDNDIQTDLLVVGGGFTGCSASLEAARSGADVVLLEANSIAFGGSGRNVGLVNAGLWLPPNDIVEILGQTDGARLIETLGTAPDEVFEIIARERISCDAVRNGTLHLAHNSTAFRNLKERFRQGSLACAKLRLLDSEETIERTGSNAFFGALFDPRAGTIQPLAYCQGLADAAIAEGASFYQNSSVTNLHHDGSVWIARVNGSEVRAKNILIATNAYNTFIRGAPQPEFVSVSYSQFATKPLSPKQLVRILPGGEGCWDTALVMTSLRLDRDGRVVIGGMGNSDGLGAVVHKKWAYRKLKQIYPELAGLEFQHCWSGRIAMTSDHIPRILSFGPNAFSVFGYSGRGIGPGTVFGKRAARALLFGEVDALPISITQESREAFRGIRTTYYELGSIIYHAARPSPI